MRNNALKIKRITLLAMFTSLAIVLSYVEMLLMTQLQLIAPMIFLPAVKMGLPNIVIILILYRLGIKEASIVSLVRLILSTLLFGTITGFWYSLAGSVLSLLVMGILKKMDSFSPVGVSVLGAIMHNIGQMIVAVILLQTSEIVYYMIILAATGIIGGVFVGLCGALLHKRLEKMKM